MLFPHPGISHLAFQCLDSWSGKVDYPVPAFCFWQREVIGYGKVSADANRPVLGVDVLPCKSAYLTVSHACIKRKLPQVTYLFAWALFKKTMILITGKRRWI